uniref:Origin recognition complex subunit 2 n=1 Tax=Strongyloides papillosus TaxID=174720 RepID=A0A0N5B8Z1_STREA
MAPERQFHETDEVLCYDKNFPYAELGVIFNTGSCIYRNVVIYGIGDKKEILENLQRDQLSGMPSIYFEGNSIRFGARQLLDAVNEECDLGITYTKNDLTKYAEMIKEELENTEKNFSLALLINNCDYEELIYDTTLQECLTTICSTKKIFFIGTCTHPLFPSPGSNAREELRCYFLKFSTFKYLECEDGDDDDMDVDGDEVTHKTQSIKVVYDSLTPNTKKLFTLMMQLFVKNNFKSIFSDDLFSQARDEFLVNSVTVMQEMMTEFLDHEIVNRHHDSAGKVKFILKIKKNVLIDFMESEGLELEEEEDS